MAFKIPLKVFRLPKHQRFEYKPRHWDPDKEEKLKRLAEIRKIQDHESVDSMKARISSGLRRGGKRDAEYRAKLVKQANIRLLFVLIAIIAISLALIWIFVPDLVADFMRSE